MSLKKRIVTWYTIWIVFLIVLILIMFIAFTGYLFLTSIRHDIERALSIAAWQIQQSDGLLSFSSLEEVDDGIYLFVFSEDGTRLFGRRLEVLSASYQEGQRMLSAGSSKWVISDMMMDGYYIRAAYQLPAFFTALLSDLLPLLVSAVLLVLISICGGYLIVKRAFAPFDKLIETASVIADGDDLELRLEEEKTKEGRALSEAFNSMLSRLDSSFKREKEFSDDASHELRTPVAVIKAESEYALTVLNDEKEVASSLKSIEREADRMTRLIGTLSELSRMDKKSISIDKKKFSLSSAVRRVSDGMKEIAEDKGLAFTSSLAEGIYVYADEDMIERALINLIDNAISYSKEKGSVSVNLRKEEERAVIEVRDDGIGIKEEDQVRIFDRFFQVDKARTSTSSGLGLAMVKEIAEFNDASISCSSNPGIGSTFTFTLKTVENEQIP